MQKKTCPNGHVYDSSIYGDTCPLCPSSSAGVGAQNATKMETESNAGAHTRVSAPTMTASMAGNPAPNPQGFGPTPHSFDPVGSTQVSPSISQQAQKATAQRKTVIRHNPNMMGGAGKASAEDRKLVGFLVTYNRTPMGKAYNIYEGRNIIGRDESCDIAVTDDNQMSGRHMSIRYLSGNNKFRFHDEMSSNGTYVNKELLDDGELENYDIIRVGSTLFIFIAIPQI
jgi:hypothetical protein